MGFVSDHEKAPGNAGRNANTQQLQIRLSPHTMLGPRLKAFFGLA